MCLFFINFLPPCLSRLSFYGWCSADSLLAFTPPICFLLWVSCLLFTRGKTFTIFRVNRSPLFRGGSHRLSTTAARYSPETVPKRNASIRRSLLARVTRSARSGEAFSSTTYTALQSGYCSLMVLTLVFHSSMVCGERSRTSTKQHICRSCDAQADNCFGTFLPADLEI